VVVWWEARDDERPPAGSFLERKLRKELYPGGFIYNKII
jgi:hypothetical protein